MRPFGTSPLSPALYSSRILTEEDILYGPQVGDVVDGRYELLEEIGCGGHGVVFRAADRELASTVAVKLLRQDVVNPKLRVRMQREARAMGQLAGTCAVQVLEVCAQDDGGMYLVMEYLDGKNLGHLLKTLERRGRRLPRKAFGQIFEPIVDTLELAHERQIIHRDLKPSNIFVLRHDIRGRVRLLDFGMAKDLSLPDLTAPGMVTGSPPFVAPEAWRGKSDVIDHLVDVYGFGVVLFRVLSGRLPFPPGRGLVDLVFAVTRGPRPKLTDYRPDLPAGVDEWTARVLAVSPTDRYPGVRDAWLALIDVLFG